MRLGHTVVMDLRDWLEIVLEYLKVLAWPIVVAGLILVFRRSITDVLYRLEDLKGPGISAKLTARAETKIRTLRDTPVVELLPGPQAKNQPTPAPVPDTPKPQSDRLPNEGASLTIEEMERQSNDFLYRHSRKWEEGHSISLVTAAWSSLVQKSSDLGSAIGMSSEDSRDIIKVSNRLLAGGRIGAETADLIDELVDLHNRALHDPRIQVTGAFANDFVRTAEKISGLFTQMLEALRL